MVENDRFLSDSDFAAILRKHPTAAEQAMWEILHRDEFNGFRFRRQYRLGSSYADIAAPAIKLAIELDGASHDNRLEEDAARDRAFAERGWLVLRFRNEEVFDNWERVAAAVLNACESRPRWRY